MKAIGYTRVSTDEQGAEGVSLEAQRERIEAWAKAHGYELVAMHSDTLSGKRADNRPGLQRALSDVCQAKGVLVVLKLDRLARSVRDAIDIAERVNGCGAQLASISESIDTTTPTGRFTFHLMSSLGQLERETTAERTRLALAHKRKKGERVSRFAPFGYRFTDDNRVIADTDEQRTLAMIVGMRSRGFAYNRIATQLNERGVAPRRGARWYGKVVQDICKRSEAMAA